MTFRRRSIVRLFVVVSCFWASLHFLTRALPPYPFPTSFWRTARRRCVLWPAFRSGTTGTRRTKPTTGKTTRKKEPRYIDKKLKDDDRKDDKNDRKKEDRKPNDR